MIPGWLRFENDIDVGEVVVLMTTKGEVIAIGIAEIPTAVMATDDHGAAAKIKRVVMDRGTYQEMGTWSGGSVRKMMNEGSLISMGNQLRRPQLSEYSIPSLRLICTR